MHNFIRAQGTMEYLVIIAVVIVISLVVVGMSGALVSNSGGQVATNTTDLSSRSGSTSGGIAIVESATDSSGNGLIKLNNFTGESFSLTKISTVDSSGSLVDNNFDSVHVDSSGALAFSLNDLEDACSCNAGETKKSCTFVIEYSTPSGLTKSQRLTTNVACVSAISTSGTYINPADFVGPVISITTPTSGSTSTTSDVDFEYTVTDNNAVKECSLLIDDVVEDTDASAPFDLFAYTFPSNGDYDYEIECEDYSSNTGSDSGTVTLGFDEDVPSVTLSSPADDYSTGMALVDFNFYVSDNNALTSCALTIDGADVNTTTNVTNSAYHVLSYTFSSYDTYSWDVNCIDYSNNSATSGAARDVTYALPVLSFSPTWVKNPESGSGASDEYPQSIAVDSSGNVYATGYFSSTTIGFGGVSNDINLTNRGGDDFFVVKYNSSGVAQWAKNPVSGSGTGNDQGHGITVDSSGNVYVVGSFVSSTVGFGGVSNDVNLTLRGGGDFFVVKYNSSGVAQWAKNAVSGSGTGSENARSVAVDTSGNIYVTGDSQTPTNGLSFGGVSNDVNLTYRGGNYDFFVVKYNSSGVAQWAKNPVSGSGKYDDSGYSVAVDSDSNVYVGGITTYADVSFGGVNNDVNLIHDIGVPGSTDFFVVKYNSSGVAQWVKYPAQGSGTSSDSVSSIFVDSSNNVYAAGSFYFASPSNGATLGFGGTNNDVNLTNRGADNYDFFVVKYNSSGVAQWAKNAASGSGSGYDSASAVSADTSGNVYIIGVSSLSIGFGSDKNLTNRGSYDFFVVMYNFSGVPQWAHGPASGSGSGFEWAYSIAAGTSSNVYFIGNTASTSLGFGNDVNLTNRGGRDFFAVKGSYS